MYFSLETVFEPEDCMCTISQSVDECKSVITSTVYYVTVPTHLLNPFSPRAMLGSVQPVQHSTDTITIRNFLTNKSLHSCVRWGVGRRAQVTEKRLSRCPQQEGTPFRFYLTS